MINVKITNDTDKTLVKIEIIFKRYRIYLLGFSYEFLINWLLYILFPLYLYNDQTIYHLKSLAYFYVYTLSRVFFQFIVADL